MAEIEMNIPKLRGKIAENGYNLTSISRELGIDRNTMTSYLHNPGKMPYSIVCKLASMLCRDVEEMRAIFLAQDLR